MQEMYSITPEDPTIVLDDFVILCQGGKIVGRLGITVDFSKCPAEYAQLMFNVLRPVKIGMPTFEDMEKSGRDWDKRKEKLNNVWYKRLWRWMTKR